VSISAFSEKLPEEINHPASEGWRLNAYTSMPGHALDALYIRYAGMAPGRADGVSDIKLRDVIEELEIASAQDSYYRSHEERANINHIGRLVNTDEYVGLATNPARVTEYIKWFGGTASRALRSGVGWPAKVGLELFGSVRQWGDWNRTRSLDKMMMVLPQVIEASGISPDYTFFDKNSLPDDKPIKYKYRPHLHHCPEDTKEQSPGLVRFGTIERWRPEADVWLNDVDPSSGPVMFFKRSRAVIVLSMLSLDERSALQIHNVVSTEEQEIANKVAGDVFERAIKAPIDATIDTIPVGAHYVQMMRRDTAVSIEDE
jgi:hypothetical protein